MIDLPNLVTMHRATALHFGPRAALRYKRLGLYHDISWNDYRHQADCVAAGLLSIGIKPGDRVGLFSENRYEWLIADIGILTAGAIDVPLHAPLTPDQAAYQLQHSGVKCLIVSDQAQLEKIKSIRSELPGLEWIISFQPAQSELVPNLLTWPGLIQRGHSLLTQYGTELSKIERSLTGDDLATIIYTSGTTGRPKGVMLSHGNLLSNAVTTVRSGLASSNDVLLSWLPYSHIYARTCDHYVTMVTGATVCLADSIDTLLVNLAEIQPTDFTSVPRFYEKVWSAIQGLPDEERAARLHRIFGPRIRRLSSGGAPLPRHVADGFLAAGFPLLEGYGLTECSPVISFNRQDAFKMGTVGQAVEGVEIRIADDGEILTRGPHVMKGYWNDSASTNETIVNGWLHTGDVGHLDSDGYLTITDRKKDLIITSGGKNIAPSELERLLVSDPYIDQAIIYGDRRPFVSALIVPNIPLLAEKARVLGCTLHTEGELIVEDLIHQFLKTRVQTLMEQVSKPERVKEILILGHALEVERDEITATHKVRRRYLISKFASELEAIYASVDAGRMLLSEE